MPPVWSVIACHFGRGRDVAVRGRSLAYLGVVLPTHHRRMAEGAYSERRRCAPQKDGVPLVMTIKVYRADPETGTREPLCESVTTTPGDPERPQKNILAWPPCKCPRCKAPAQ